MGVAYRTMATTLLPCQLPEDFAQRSVQTGAQRAVSMPGYMCQAGADVRPADPRHGALRRLGA